MKAAVWYGQKDVRVEDREPKAIKDNEVQVKVSSVSVVLIYMNIWKDLSLFQLINRTHYLVKLHL